MCCKKYILVVYLSLITCSSFAAAVEEDPYPLWFLQRNLSQILVNDNIAPPLAARDYVYPHLAAYYVLTAKSKGKKIYESIPHFPVIRVSGSQKYPVSLAASVAFYEVAKAMIYTQQPFIDSFKVLLKWYEKNGADAISIRNAQQAGKQVAAGIIAWMHKDMFTETRRMNKYVLLRTAGSWQLTSPGYFPALEPHWGKVRPMLYRKPAAADIITPIAFSTDTTSDFYKQANHVYMVSSTLTKEQRLIASYWDCNPFALQPRGHINVIVKKISPGGHWMSITGIASKAKQFNLLQTSEAYTLCAIGLFDGFIYTWQQKYQYSLLRPETYIEQAGIDANWQPLLQSPPFPEFPSGHAVISNAAAGILTSIFGKDFSFTDDTEVAFGLPKRTFTSLQAAADEATISRVYGGIHYIFSCESGQVMGKNIARDILREVGKL